MPTQIVFHCATKAVSADSTVRRRTFLVVVEGIVVNMVTKLVRRICETELRRMAIGVCNIVKHEGTYRDSLSSTLGIFMYLSL